MSTLLKWDEKGTYSIRILGGMQGFCPLQGGNDSLYPYKRRLYEDEKNTVALTDGIRGGTCEHLMKIKE